MPAVWQGLEPRRRIRAAASVGFSGPGHVRPSENATPHWLECVVLRRGWIPRKHLALRAWMAAIGRVSRRRDHLLLRPGLMAWRGVLSFEPLDTAEARWELRRAVSAGLDGLAPGIS